VPLSFQLPRGWWLVLSPELDCYHNLNSDGYHLEAANTFYFCHQIAGKFSGYADFFATISAEKGVPWTGIMDFGLTYAWTRNLQVDLGLSVGVTDKADDLNPYLGFSFRL
jgi:hypothetical protein